LFKADEEEEKEGEIDLDAILEQAEVREEADDDAHQSEANKELLGAFKCTTIAFEETEKEVKPDQEQADKKLDWTDIIPEELRREEEEEKDPDVLTPNPDGQRRRRRIKKLKTDDSPDKSKVNSSPSSSYENSDSEASDDEDDDGSDNEMEQKLKKAVKKKEGPARTYTKKIKGMKKLTRDKKLITRCFPCGKSFSRYTYLAHIGKVHDDVEPPENSDPANLALPDDMVKEKKKLNTRCFPCRKSFSERYMYKAHIKQVHDDAEPPENSDPANLALPDDMAKVEKKSNTRCFPCGKSFSRYTDYKAHIKKDHDDVEPPENSDPANLALPDERISCLICSKKFGNKQNLKSHIKTHLGTARGIASKNNQGSGSKDEEEKEDKKYAVSLDQDPLADPLGDVHMESNDAENLVLVHTEENPNPDSLSPKRFTTEEEKVLIEKMFNSMRRYGCSHCEQRFDTIPQLKNHEKQHKQNQKAIKDANAPKKPLTAYSLFAQEEGAKVRIENPEYSIADLGKELGRRWANIDPSLKQQYEKTYQEAKTIYDRENGRGKPQNKKKDPNAPKHPLNAYLLFSAEERNKIKEDTPNISLSDLGIELGRRWAELDQTIKQKFRALAEEAKKKYDLDMAAYRNVETQKKASPVISDHVVAVTNRLSFQQVVLSFQTAPAISVHNLGSPNTNQGKPHKCSTSLVGGVTVNEKSVSGKCKENAFRCTECNARLDKRLEVRVQNRPEEGFGDIGPNFDIVVSSNNTENGYEVYKVISVYTTGMRFKCAKYTHVSQDRWTLTEEINKNVMKVNIIKVLKTLKKDEGEKNVYTMDMEELESLTNILTT